MRDKGNWEEKKEEDKRSGNIRSVLGPTPINSINTRSSGGSSISCSESSTAFTNTTRHNDSSSSSSSFSCSINHNGHNNKRCSESCGESGLVGDTSRCKNNMSGNRKASSAMNSFHERLIVSIESAISSGNAGGRPRNTRRNSDNDDRFLGELGTTTPPPPQAYFEGGGCNTGGKYGEARRTTYNSIRSGSCSVGHSPKKSGRMTTSVVGNTGGGAVSNQTGVREGPSLEEKVEDRSGSENNKERNSSNHQQSSISSFISALSRGGGANSVGGGGNSGVGGGARNCFSSVAGVNFPSASGLGNFITSSFNSASSSFSQGRGPGGGSSGGGSPETGGGARGRAASVSFSVRNHREGGVLYRSPQHKPQGNHIKLNSKVEKVLNSIPGLTLGQVQGAAATGVAGGATTPSPSAAPPTTCTWGNMNSTPNSSQVITSNCNSVKTPVLPQVQIQIAPQPENPLKNQQEQPPHCPSPSKPPLTVTPAEPTQQRKHSATFSAFKLNDSGGPPKRPLKLKNHSVTTLELYDTLHFKSSATPQSGHCTDHVCLGSIVSFPTVAKPSVAPVHCRPVEEVRRLAKDFFDQYYTSIKRFNSTNHVQRWEQVLAELEETGTYNLTETELVYGAKLAWRNSVRCIGRIQWAKLQVFDARSVTTTTGMFEAVCKHIKYATNKGNIRSAITIFPQRTDGKHDFRIWNPQLITYAGYREPDGSITGDPLSVEFTEVCTKLGWKGKHTKWDILPLVLSADGHDPEYFEIPSELIVEIPIRHPSFEWFADMDLRWYALPAVSGMLFDCGGLEFTACPFNGWYMGTEIGCRDLGDVHRYNVLEEVAIRMGLDTKNPTTLWKDRAVVELNLAVLHSYQKAGVTVVDHHTASESFMKHYETEMRVRGGCPADWVWIVPPMSGSATPVFHQEMALYHLKPNYEYQDPAWKTHVWKKGSTSSQRDGGGGHSLGKSRKGARRKFHFKEIARAVKFTSKLFGKALSKRVKATILYATETGKSEMYARRLEEIFGHAFNAQVCKMEEYDIINIEHETLILVVTSTFGNGDPPENGESFAHSLFAIKMNQGLSLGADDLSMASSKSFIKMNSQTDSVAAAERRFDRNDSLKGSQISDIMSDDNFGPLRNITFAVFALGSSAYPNFCAFGRYVDNLLGELGGERLMRLTCGDELAGQDQAFRTWAGEIFQTAADSFCLDFDKNMVEISAALKADTLSPESVRFLPVQEADDEVKALSKLHNRTVAMYNMMEKVNLHDSDELSRVTIKVVLRKETSKAPLSYQSGDHVGIMAENRSELITYILDRLADKPSTDDEPIQVQLLQEKHTPMGVQKQWIPHERLPKCSIRTLLTRYLDVTTPPRPNLLLYLVRCTEDPEEQERLNSLAKDPDVYEHWKQFYWPNLVTVLEQFPKVRPEATVLVTMLPLLQPRFYSVSSSPLAYSDELHLTVAVVTYKTRGGEGPLHYGVCSNYLNDVDIGGLVPCFVRSAVSFHMPADTSRPMIMIGPGTGIAPFRGFWQERRLKVKEHPNARFGKMTLFFGCRTKEMILYRGELEALKKEGILSDIFLALSREPSVKKTYVQDLLRREGDSVCRQIMQENGHIYVCGDCTMAEDVYQTLKSIVQEIGNFTDQEVESYMLSLRDDNRYHEDIFGITHRTAEVHEKVRQTAMTRIESNYSLSNANVSK